MRRSPSYRFGSWVPVVLVAAFIFGESSFNPPVPRIGEVPLSSLAHAFVFALLGMALYRAFVREGMPAGRAALFSLAICTTYGVLDEVHQLFTAGRDADVADVAFDAGGALFAIAVAAWWRESSN